MYQHSKVLLAGLLLIAPVGYGLAGNPPPTEPQAPTAAAPVNAAKVDMAQVQRDFVRLDVDKSGTLSPTEAESDVALQAKFAAFDIDDNALLSQVEYRSYAISRLDPEDDLDEEEEAE